MTVDVARPLASHGSPDHLSDRWPSWWALSSSCALLAMTAWQRTPTTSWLAVAAVSTLLSAWFARSVKRPRLWALVAAAALAISVGVAARDTADLATISRDWAAWSAAERESRASVVAERLTETGSKLQAAASALAGDASTLGALDSINAAQPAAGPVTTLSAPLDGGIESALLVFRGPTLIARAGQTRTRISPFGASGLELVDEAFYSSLVARAASSDGKLMVVAVALVSAIPPADRFSRALTQTWTRDVFAGGVDASRTVIESPDSTRVAEGTTVILVPNGDRRLARVRALARSEGETQLMLLQEARLRTGLPLAIAVLAMLVVGWRRPARTVHRIGIAATLLLALAVAPLSALSNVSALFDATSYFASMGGPWTANVASLLLTTSLGLALLFLTLRSGRVTRLTSSRLLAGLLVALSATIGPFVLRDLARGIALPADGVTTTLWISWQLAIALAGASVLHAGAAAGRTVLGNRRGLPAMTAPVLAIVAATMAPVLWDAPGAWPAWYPALWVLAIGALALTRRGVALVTGAAVIAGAGAVTLTWGATVRARMNLAQFDLARLSAVDENAYRLLQRFAANMMADAQAQARADLANGTVAPRPRVGSGELLRRYAASELAQAGYPAKIARWDSLSTRTPSLDIALVPVADTLGAQGILASIARASGTIEIRAVDDGPTTLLIAAIPGANGMVTTVAVPPRTRLLANDPFASLTGIAERRSAEAPYRLTLAPVASTDTAVRTLQWRRRGDAMHGDAVTSGGEERRAVHVQVELRPLDALVPRGALLVLLDVAVVLLLWVSSAMADGAFGRWFRRRRVRLFRSYRARLSAALLAFFIAPATLFAGWSWYRLQDDDRAARELVVREALRTAASEAGRRDLATTAANIGSPIFVFRTAQLEAASDSLLQALAPLGRLLPITLDAQDAADDVFDDESFPTRRIAVGASQALIGVRRVNDGKNDLVVVTPARSDEFALDTRRRDLGVLLGFAAALGAFAAMWLSGVAARALARPVGALREAALAIAAGGDARALGRAPASEFSPVYRAFGRMAEDLSASREALEAAQRRTAAVLQNVASGVIALHQDGAIVIANPRAKQLLGMTFGGADGANDAPRATVFSLPESLAPLASRCRAFLEQRSDEDAFELLLVGRQLRGRLTRLPNGAVLTLDDVTELASAQRVLAWGEMARQVAHEIKNPLTPIRLGVQHLRRAYRDGRGDFSAILETNVGRVLEEIDHLDEIARAFSRYGTAPDQRPPAVAVDVAGIARDVLALEQLGESGVAWSLDGVAEHANVLALGQRDELKEVVLNLLENARLAQAQRVRMTVQSVRDASGAWVALDVQDDGVGIAAEVIPHVFEPHFSTRTSGSGLGLAISRRLIEGWGGRITIESTPGTGTVVHVRLRAV
ncbi:MAG: hypothetical protein IT353_19925 [Gemmatimonadaceae bacterium]|nr:hypothetical protein [Gemmatimonadaceae bacterium]